MPSKASAYISYALLHLSAVGQSYFDSKGKNGLKIIFPRKCQNCIFVGIKDVKCAGRFVREAY